MYVRSALFIALLVASAGFTGCSGGGSNNPALAVPSCAGNTINALCLSSCSLGCSGTGCQITNIAQNASVIFVFNSDIDPTSVSDASVRFRTAAGETPVGQYNVHGSIVEFVPQVLVVGGQSFFGFRSGESYTLTLPGGANEINALRSTHGLRLKDTVTCTLRVTLGIVDLNGVPPSATLISPTVTINVPDDVTIQLEFNEIIDYTPFIGTNAATGPITYSLRRTRLDQLTGQRECNTTSPLVPLNGAPRVDVDTGRSVSVVTFQPTQPLPDNVCVEVSVTSRVRDLSGRPAQPQTFLFHTHESVAPEVNTTEAFVDETNLDRDASSGSWSGGQAVFGVAGGDGLLGDFDLNNASFTFVGVVDGKNTYEINTDNSIFPLSSTSTSAVAVTDGKFRFTKMSVPSNTRLRFVGNSPPMVQVRGRLDVNGVIDVRGRDQVWYPSIASTLVGQPGAAGGVFGGAGGNGADKCPGTGALPNYSGLNGQNCRVPVGHAFAGSVINTGGLGSPLFPASGLLTDLLFNTGTVPYSLMATSGGGGGGYVTAGGSGMVIYNTRTEARATGTISAATATTLVDQTRAAGGTSTPWVVNEWVGMRVSVNTATVQTRLVVANTDSQLTVDQPWTTTPTSTNSYQLPLTTLMGPRTAGGVALPGVLAGQGSAPSSLYYLIGGSGGGGGGGQPLFCSNFAAGFAPGNGGGGGGGVLALRVGEMLRLDAAGQILASGGVAGQVSTGAATIVSPSPAGGGSGGTLLLQCGNHYDLAGLIDVRGGGRGYFNRATALTPAQGGGTVEVAGGAGSPGFLRLEAPTAPDASAVPQAQPPVIADNLGALTETDGRVGFRSNFYSVGQPYGPEYLRYEITALVDGQVTTYSDKPNLAAPGFAGQAVFPLAPIEVSFQAAAIDTSTGLPVFDPARNLWVHRVGSFGGDDQNLDAFGLNGFRFQIILDHTLGRQVVITQVKIVYSF